MKLATAYKRSGKIILHSSSKTVHGLWIPTPPFLLASLSDLVDLGAKISSVLDAAKENIAHPTSLEEFGESIYKIAGVKNWNMFVKSAKCVSIEFETNRVKFLSMKNLGARDGFEPINTKARTSAPVDLEMASQLAAAFDDAQ
jgi:hypothetical protein